MPRFFLIAGETSGDILAAELVTALKTSPRLAALLAPPEFLGAGGRRMEAAGVRLAIDLTQHAVFGISDVVTQYLKFRGIFRQLFRLALEWQPDVIILVDYAGFNRRFAGAIKRFVRARRGPFHNWDPKIAYYVSPQVWASRESRVYQIARDVDLLLSIFPFEKAWYRTRVPDLRVEFVGHPMIDRYAHIRPAGAPAESRELPRDLVVLLPGSRKREVEAHLPIMLQALAKIGSHERLRARMILPCPSLADLARRLTTSGSAVEIQIGGLAETLQEAALAIASSGTVTLECAFFRVPTVVVYKTSWPTYWIARQIVRVPHIAMPNLLAGKCLFPELIQSQASGEKVAREALDLLTNAARRQALQMELVQVIATLGQAGACVRAANHVLGLLSSGRRSQ